MFGALMSVGVESVGVDISISFEWIDKLIVFDRADPKAVENLCEPTTACSTDRSAGVSPVKPCGIRSELLLLAVCRAFKVWW